MIDVYQSIKLYKYYGTLHTGTQSRGYMVIYHILINAKVCVYDPKQLNG